MSTQGDCPERDEPSRWTLKDLTPRQNYIITLMNDQGWNRPQIARALDCTVRDVQDELAFLHKQAAAAPEGTSVRAWEELEALRREAWRAPRPVADDDECPERDEPTSR
jgi:hypothetical protein